MDQDKTSGATKEDDKYIKNQAWTNDEFHISGQLKYHKISNNIELKSERPILVIYSGHLRSFSETYKTHPQELCTQFNSFVTIMHTWDTVYPETLSWHKQNINKEPEEATSVLDIINSVVVPDYLRIDSQDVSIQYRIDKNNIETKSLDGMNYGLMFFKHSRRSAISMALQFAQQHNLSEECLCIIMRPDIALRNSINYDVLLKKLRNHLCISLKLSNLIKVKSVRQ